MRYGLSGQPSLYIAIGEEIMVARRRAHLSQRQLGERLGVSHAAVSDIETGKTRPNLDVLAVIAEALGVPLSQIVCLGRTRAPAAPPADGAGPGGGA